jgi:lysophospholipase L1-like esterase
MTSKPKTARRKKRSRLSLRKKIIFSMILFAFCGLIALLALELFVRLVRPQPLSPPLYRVTDWGFAIKPNLDNVHVESDDGADYKISTDSLGLRNTDNRATSPKPDNTRRVLILGDSYTFGVGVDQAETFPAVTEKLLNTSGTLKYQIINAGTPGWGTQNQLALWREKGKAMQPDTVVIAYYQNDLDDNLRYPLFTLADGKVMPNPAAIDKLHDEKSNITNFIPLYDWLCSHSHLINYLRRTIAARQQVARMESGQAAHQSSPGQTEPTTHTLTVNLERYDGKIYLRDRFNLYETLMQEMINDITSSGADVVILLIAGPTDLTGASGARYTEAERLARQWAGESENIQALSLRPVFGPLHFKEKRKLYLDVDRHFSIEGNRAAAEALTPLLLHSQTEDSN